MSAATEAGGPSESSSHAATDSRRRSGTPPARSARLAEVAASGSRGRASSRRNLADSAAVKGSIATMTTPPASASASSQVRSGSSSISAES